MTAFTAATNYIEALSVSPDATALSFDYVVDPPPGRLSAVSSKLVPTVDCNCGTIQPFGIFYSRTMDSSGSPGTATFGNDSSSGSTGMLAVPAIADSPDTQQSASSGISHDLSHSSWKEVGHAVWSKDGEKKRSSSASLSTPRRSVKGVMSPARKEKGRSKSPTGSSPSKITQENKTLKQEVEEAKRHLAMLQESYERDDQGNVTRIQELERRAGMSEQLASPKDPTNNFEKLLNTSTFNVGRQSYPKIRHNTS